EKSARFRLDTLNLGEHNSGFRLINSDGDSLSGLIVDKYADLLVVTVHSFGIWRHLDAIIQRLHAVVGTKRAMIKISSSSVGEDGMPEEAPKSGIESVQIVE